MAYQPVNDTAIVLNLPVFDTINVNVWFAQLEAIFQAKHIHSQMACYVYVVEKLPPEIASDVLDLLDTVPTNNPFDTLKEAIIYRTGKSQEHRRHDLFNTLQLGENKPTQLLRRMKNLLGNTQCLIHCSENFGSISYQLKLHKS